MSEAHHEATGWAAGLSILRARHERLPAAVLEALTTPRMVEEPARVLMGARAVVTTGVGSSLAHARYLAWLLRTRCAIPSWDVPTGSYLSPPGPEAHEQALVIFSQGLSPNARLPLVHADRYRATVLVTAADNDSPDRSLAVRAAREKGVLIVPMPCAPEYEVLLRLLGPMVGYTVALSLANAAGASIPINPEAISAAIHDASDRMSATLAGVDPRVLADPITFIATSGYAALAHNLSAKVLEGMFLPWPAAVDALELAHGSLQEAAGKPRTFVALGRGAQHERELYARAKQTLEPQHLWLDVEARLPEPLAVLEHEAMINVLVLASIAARRLDQREWPGKGRDAPLYSVRNADDLAGAAAPLPPPRPTTSRRLEDLTWPEIEARIAQGLRTVVVPLGATEQHGPHLPLSVDTLVADALAARFCVLVPEAMQAPTIAIGCSSEHLAFPGTLSLSPSTLSALLADVIASLTQHGFEHVVVFSAHGGNDASLVAAEAHLAVAAAPALLTIVHGIDDIGRLWQEVSERAGAPPGAAGHHAGEFETSIVAALRPDAVRWPLVREGVSANVPDPQRLFYPSLRANAPEGVVGDPSQASSDRAERYLAAWVTLLVDRYNTTARARRSNASRGAR